MPSLGLQNRLARSSMCRIASLMGWERGALDGIGLGLISLIVCFLQVFRFSHLHAFWALDGGLHTFVCLIFPFEIPQIAVILMAHACEGEVCEGFALALVSLDTRVRDIGIGERLNSESSGFHA